MDDPPRSAVVAALVSAIDTRTSYQTDWITRALMGGAWPGGHADRTYSSAAEWVRHWGPPRMREPYRNDCACAHGRCLVCN
jgi:hypothetical protein